ncbi:uncharacterized protein [Watersipora subatra]|uniref:uncharacterized protein n=1 Tax=Watersipora subatra TaxID=2589382 RepID=UPI00355C9747
MKKSSKKTGNSSRIITRDDVSRAVVVDRVKTDAMFGYGRPRLHVDSGVLPEVSKDFDVIKFIRDTMRDLSYTHPILNRRRFNLSSARKQNQDTKVKTPENCKRLLREQSVHEIDVPVLDTPAMMYPKADTPKDSTKTSLVLPSVYDHQGYRATRRDFRISHGICPLNIQEAKSYFYVRSVPHQFNHSSNGSDE